jgi:histidyl-tRNA synthetase
LVIGEDEAERGEVRLKALNQQTEESTVAIQPVDAIVELLGAH